MTYKLIERVNPNIKVGDIVEIKDWSYLTTDEGKEVNMFDDLRELTGKLRPLKELSLEVIKTGCKNIRPGHTFDFETDIILQDIELKAGDLILRTLSDFVLLCNPIKRLFDSSGNRINSEEDYFGCNGDLIEIFSITEHYKEFPSDSHIVRMYYAYRHSLHSHKSAKDLYINS